MSFERENELPKMSSVLGSNAVVVGNATGKGDLEVRGRVQGDVLLQGRALVAEEGVVLGRIEAIDIIVAGKVRGDLKALEGIVVHPSGDVEGNIEAPRVTILAGARVRGSLRAGESQPKAGDVHGTEHAPISVAASLPPLVTGSSSHGGKLERTPVDAIVAPTPSRASTEESEVRPSLVAELPRPKDSRPRGKGRPKAIPSFQKGARAELKDAE